jgi:pimeloyl-ACP methyl ester carboxylesterase/DNA-binding CsgD family transcriptional regulator
VSVVGSIGVGGGQHPPTLFVKSDGLNIAYQVFGSGPPVLAIPPVLSNVELAWENALLRRWLEYWGRHVTYITFDKRGIGISDRFEELPTLDQRINDITAVMDAAGFDRVSLLGVSEGGLMAQRFAALFPERVDKVVLVNSAIGLNGVWSPSQDELEKLLERFIYLIESWGRDPEYMVDWFTPSQSGNQAHIEWMGRYQRQSATPADHARQAQSIAMLEGLQDLTAIRVPTLVSHVRGDRVAPIEGSRRLAAAIPGAEFVELEGEDHFHALMPSAIRDSQRMLSFLTGERPSDWHERRPPVGWEALTPAENRVVEFLAAGYSNQQIADALYVSLATVKTHLGHVFQKLNLRSRAQVVAALREREPDSAG